MRKILTPQYRPRACGRAGTAHPFVPTGNTSLPHSGGNLSTSDFERAFPSALRNVEDGLVRQRRTEAAVPIKLGGIVKMVDEKMVDDSPRVGLAISGGGIRSATFGLGVLQALAASKLLRRFDYLSTVSGGGYIGSFLSALFAREDPVGLGQDTDTAAETADTTRVAAVERALSNLRNPLIRWLRENGRYLSPNGAGDTLLGAAVMLRNWVAVQLVLGTLVLAVFVALNLVRALLSSDDGGFMRDGYVIKHLWCSPYFALPIFLLVVWAIPAGWAYWLVPPPKVDGARKPEHWLPLATHALFLTLQVGALVLAPVFLEWQVAALVATAFTLVFFAAAFFYNERDSAHACHLLSVWLKRALVIVVALAVLALIDSLGQTVYVAITERGAFWRWLASTIAAIGGAAAFGQKLPWLGAMDREKRLRLPIAVVALMAALLLTTVVLVSIATAAHAIGWMAQQPSADFVQRLIPSSNDPEVSLTEERHIRVSPTECPQDACAPREHAPAMSSAALGATLLLLLGLSLSFGQTRAFMNQSSLAPLYGSRLRRAYLGASNPERAARASGASVTDDVDGDEVRLGDYRPWERGGPLHIINVTLNETVSGETQTEQRDRRGLPMAFGPAGVSVGVRHHALQRMEADKAIVLEALQEADPARFQIFDPLAGPIFHPERLDVSRLVAISGAAVSTGIGSRTSLGLSLLVGLFNVRLGHWWWSGIDPNERRGAHIYDVWRPWASLGQAFSRTFSVQAHFLDELTARFHGPMRRNWYLSDGGHFENTGCYELLRRRIPMIVVIDDGADGTYRFEDFAQLVRKARLDFGATMREATAEELDKIDTKVRGAFGTFDELRGNRDGLESDSAGRRWNEAHAALVIVEYTEPAQQSLVIWIKPTITKDVPEDVLHYALEHLEFPQEPIGDQYFDEAQWESYRRLGQYIGELVFGSPGVEPSGSGWHPRNLSPSLDGAASTADTHLDVKARSFDFLRSDPPVPA